MKARIFHLCVVASLLLALSDAPRAGAQPTLANGVNEAGFLPTNTVALFTLNANTGDNIVLRLGTVGFNGYLNLYGPGNVLLKSAASGFDAELDYTPTNSGAFTVAVSSYYVGGYGNYVLWLAQFPEPFVVPGGQQGGPMTNGVAYSGTNSLGNLAMWSFNANAGDNIVLRLGTVGYNGNLRLYGPTGALLITTASGTDAQLEYTATNRGTFTALVSSYASGGVGNYTLHLAQFPEPFVVPSGLQGGPMTNGGIYTGTNSMGNLAMWSFNANTGDNVVLRLGTAGYNGDLKLYGPTGALLGNVASGTDAELDYTATDSGTFTALVSSYASGGVGNYTLHFTQFPEPFIVPAGQQGGPMTNGGIYTGTNSMGNLAMWSFTANAGENIALRLATAGYNGDIKLFGPTGALLKNVASGTDAELDYTATNSGTFTALVSSYASGGVGTYTLYFAQFPEPFIVPAGQQGGPMTNGGSYTGTNSLGNLAMWSFNANAGDSMVLRLGTVGYNGYLRLFGPTGALLKTAASGADAELDYTATNSGTFTALVCAFSSGGVGTYTLDLAQFPEGFIVPPGDQGGGMNGSAIYTGTINLGGLDIWAFTACKGDAINLELKTTNFNGFLRLYGETGVLLSSAASGTDAVLHYTATNCGTFAVLVCSASSGGTGTYGLLANALSNGLKICAPVISGTNLTINGIGGPTNASFVVSQSANIATPANLWIPIFTNRFDQFGTFSFTNLYNPAQPRMFFRFVLP